MSKTLKLWAVYTDQEKILFVISETNQPPFNFENTNDKQTISNTTITAANHPSPSRKDVIQAQDLFYALSDKLNIPVSPVFSGRNVWK